jgi:catechol 2,3-dioxygenase-like lactoylglutathione lyase family enzyme
MDWKIELLAVPVTDIDRAKDFYVKIGFNADHDHTVDENTRFVQLTPPGSACSIVLDTNFTEMAPGSVKGIQCVVASAETALEQLKAVGVEAIGVDEQAWGRFVYFSDPDGNGWALQELVPYES